MVRRRSVLPVLAVAVAAASFAPAAAQAQEVPQVVANIAPFTPTVNASPSGTFTMHRARLDCAAVDSAAVSVTVRCWTENGLSSDVITGSASGGAVTAGNIVGFSGAPAFRLAAKNYDLCAEAVFTYGDGSTRTVGGNGPGQCAPDDWGTATVTHFPS
jgi:hypothetical protein